LDAFGGEITMGDAEKTRGTSLDTEDGMGALDRRRLRRRARLFRALAHESRLMILALLAEGEICVCDLARATGLDQSTVSKHLSLLAGNGLVEGNRRGHHVYYRLTAPWVVELLHCGDEGRERQE
jgi:DNA-binding transcriptional ArsR family regulator